VNQQFFKFFNDNLILATPYSSSNQSCGHNALLLSSQTAWCYFFSIALPLREGKISFSLQNSDLNSLSPDPGYPDGQRYPLDNSIHYKLAVDHWISNSRVFIGLMCHYDQILDIYFLHFRTQ